LLLGDLAVLLEESPGVHLWVIVLQIRGARGCGVGDRAGRFRFGGRCGRCCLVAGRGMDFQRSPWRSPGEGPPPASLAPAPWERGVGPGSSASQAIRATPAMTMAIPAWSLMRYGGRPMHLLCARSDITDSVLRSGTS